MKKRLLLVITLLVYVFLPSGKAQDTLSCELLKRKVRSAIDSCKTIRVRYVAGYSNTELNYEIDSASNTHLICTLNNKKLHGKYMLVQVKGKKYPIKAIYGKETNYEMVPTFKFNQWIDSCTSAIKILKNPIQNCISSRKVELTGTLYEVFKTNIQRDSFFLWINRKNNKLERIVSIQEDKKLMLEYYFDIPFTVTAPPIDLKDIKGFGFQFFPPAFSTYEDYKGNEPIFTIPDTPVQFQGGSAKMFEELATHIHYPKDARDKGVQGKVVTTFIMEKDGSISNYVIRRSVNPACDAEALRVIKLLEGKWSAATHNGQKVRMVFTLPIVFKIE